MFIGAYVDLKECTGPALALHRTAASNLQSIEVFKRISERVAADPATAKKINAVFVYIITKDKKEAGKWSEYILIFYYLFCSILLFDK